MIHHAMQTTFLAPGIQARDRDAARVMDNAGDPWAEAIRRIIAGLARRLPEFTADDVRAEARLAGIPEPHHHNAYGAALLAAAHAGLIFDTGRVARSDRPEARGRKVGVWAPLRMGGAA